MTIINDVLLIASFLIIVINIILLIASFLIVVINVVLSERRRHKVEINLS